MVVFVLVCGVSVFGWLVRLALPGATTAVCAGIFADAALGLRTDYL